MKLVNALLALSLIACSSSNDSSPTDSTTASYCSKEATCEHSNATQRDVDACVAFRGGDRGEAQAYGCGDQYDIWLACADTGFVCSDGFPTTKDCGDKQSAWHACVDAAKGKSGSCMDIGGSTDAERYCSRKIACGCESDADRKACLADQMAQANAARAYGCAAEWNAYLSCFVGSAVCRSNDFGVPSGTCDAEDARLQSCISK